MMDKADSIWGRGLTFMIKAFNTAFATAFMTVAMGSTMSCAQNPLPPKNLRYQNFQDPSFDPAYSIAWDAMGALYNGTESEKGREDVINPFMDIAQTDLNGDRMDEIIAVPVPSIPESLTLCEKNQTCPYYILEVRDRTVHTLGVIKAGMIDRGDDIVNGYWTLNVYQRNDRTGDYESPVVYVYDPAKDSYAPKPSLSSTILPRPAPTTSKP